MLSLKKYFSSIRRALNNNGLVLEYPKIFLQIIEEEGKITGIETREFKISFTKGNKITYSEIGRLTGDKYKISFHKYHFQPKKGSPLHPYRIDLDNLETPPHANDYDGDKIKKNKYNKSWPYHLYYPEHISLNINDFNLALALQTAVTYISTKNYPLENEYAVERQTEIRSNCGLFSAGFSSIATL